MRLETHLGSGLDNLCSHLGLASNTDGRVVGQLFEQLGFTKGLCKVVDLERAYQLCPSQSTYTPCTHLVPLIPQILRGILTDVLQQQDLYRPVPLSILFRSGTTRGESGGQESGELTNDGGRSVVWNRAGTSWRSGSCDGGMDL